MEPVEYAEYFDRELEAALAVADRRAWPRIDIETECCKARNWVLRQEPKARKVDVARFVTSWLDRAEKEADGRPGGNGAYAPRPLANVFHNRPEPEGRKLTPEEKAELEKEDLPF